MIGIIGKKLGMTQIFTEDGTSVPVTVIEAQPNKVTALRRADRDGYDAVQLAADPVTPENKLTKGEMDQLPEFDLLELAFRSALARHRAQFGRIHVAGHGLAFLADTSVVVDAEVAADADQPGLKIRATVERVQRLEDLEEDILRQIFGFVVPADKLVGQIEDLAPMLLDNLLPRRLIAFQAALDQLIGVGRSGDGEVAGHQWRGRRWRIISRTSDC